MGQDTQGTVWGGLSLLCDICWASVGKMQMAGSNSKSWGLRSSAVIHSHVWLRGWHDLKAVDQRPGQTGVLIILGRQFSYMHLRAPRTKVPANEAEATWPFMTPSQKSPRHFCCTMLVKAVTMNSSKFNSPNSIQFHANSRETRTSQRTCSHVLKPPHYFCRGRKINTMWVSNLPKVTQLGGEESLSQ